MRPLDRSDRGRRFEMWRARFHTPICAKHQLGATSPCRGKHALAEISGAGGEDRSAAKFFGAGALLWEFCQPACWQARETPPYPWSFTPAVLSPLKGGPFAGGS